MEIIFISNLALIFFPFEKLTRKLGSLCISVVLTGGLLLTVRMGFVDLVVFDFLKPNSHWGAFTIDNFSALFVFLTCFLVYVCVLLMEPHTYNYTLYLGAFLLLEIMLTHTFSSINLLSFYVTFETTLVPMFVIILVWGSRQRKLHAMYMFFFYTIAGSIMLLFGIFVFFLFSGSLLMSFASHLELEIIDFTYIVWICFFVGFAFKVPVVPFHTWLPEAHVEAPTAGSIILAGLLLKVGTFGLLRFLFPALNVLNFDWQPFVFTLAVFSIFYASIVALRQLDIKKIIAYSSIAHMGFVVSGLFTLTYFGLIGSYFTMLSHGIVASSLFFLVGVVYERYGTRNLLYFGGLSSAMPIYAFFFFFFVLANIGFPFTSNFIGELFILIGVLSTNLFIGLLQTFSIILAPVYSMWMFNRMFFGDVSANLLGFADLNTIELYILLLFFFFMFLWGLNPTAVTAFTEPALFKLLI